ncbi:MAG: hypothetical protein L3J75_16495 [Methylococcaceae bacterium]|nr:hypothetical protein [Methylococcaceae bacterium]
MHEKLKHKSVSNDVISLGYICSPLGLKDDIASSSWPLGLQIAKKFPASI